MSDKYRQERIERLLHELRHEVTRGMMEGDLEHEEMGFRFYVPISRSIQDGMVFCEFRTRPVPRWHMAPAGMQPKLKIVKSEG
jgi:hypothetical protein